MIINLTPEQKDTYYKTEPKEIESLLENEEAIEESSENDDALKVTASQFIEAAIRIPCKGTLGRFDFSERPYLKEIYDSPSKRKLLMAGRQVEKSTLLGNTCLTYTAIHPFFRVLYVSPSNQQTKTFSNDRIAEPIELSPFLKKSTSTKLTQNIFEKRFANKSKITLRFAFLNADRCRGIPADYINIDEFQDIALENIPVIEECASHSDYKWFTYSGTPKSLDNAIEHYWSKYSTQNEWVIPCRKHGTPKNSSSWHWNVLGLENIGDKHLICDKCHSEIYTLDKDAQWASLNPNASKNIEQPFTGYRIPQLMVPWIQWSDIVHKKNTYSLAKFHNEVLGRSYDSGTRPLTQRDVRKNCWDELSMMYYKDVVKYSQQYPLFMGIDWGAGSETSYTIVTIGGYLPFAPDKITWFYWHRYDGIESEPARQLASIKELIREFNIKVVGVDYGGGFWPNDELLREFGSDKIKKYQWVGNIRRKIIYDSSLGVPRHLCHRTEVMSDMFNSIKRGGVYWFPRWEEFESPFSEDFLNIFSEYNDRMKINVYKHAPGCPDDSFHALTFGTLASFYIKPRPDILLPSKTIKRDVYSENDALDIVSGPEDFGSPA